MKWEDFRRSDNVEDRTGADSVSGFPGGGSMKLGGGALILVVVVSLLFGVNPLGAQADGTLQDASRLLRSFLLSQEYTQIVQRLEIVRFQGDGRW